MRDGFVFLVLCDHDWWAVVKFSLFAMHSISYILTLNCSRRVLQKLKLVLIKGYVASPYGITHLAGLHKKSQYFPDHALMQLITNRQLRFSISRAYEHAQTAYEITGYPTTRLRWVYFVHAKSWRILLGGNTLHGKLLVCVWWWFGGGGGGGGWGGGVRYRKGELTFFFYGFGLEDYPGKF